MPIFLFVLSLFLSPAAAQPAIHCSTIEQLFAAQKRFSPKIHQQLKRFLTLEPQQFEAMGGDLSGQLRIYGEGPDVQMWLPKKKDVELQAFAVPITKHLLPKALITILSNGTIIVEDINGSWRIQAYNKGIIIAPSNAKIRTVELLPARYPSSGGCKFRYAKLNLPKMMTQYLGKTKEPTQVFFPFVGDSMTFRFARRGAMPKFFANKTQDLLALRGSKKPAITISFGKNPLGFVRDRLLSRVPTEYHSQVNKLVKKLKVPAGGQALVDGSEMAVVLPIDNALGCPMAAWRLWWGIKRGLDKKQWKLVGKRHATFSMLGKQLNVAVERGKLLLATSTKIMDEVRDVSKKPILDPVGQKFAQQWPLSVRMVLPTSMRFLVGPLRSIDLGIQADEQFWRLQMVPRSTGKADAVKLAQHALLLLQSTRLPPALPSEQQLLDQLVMIAVSQHAYFAQYEQYFFWSVDHPPHKGFAGYAAEALRGKVWVRSQQNGFVIHARLQNGQEWARFSDGRIAQIKPLK